MKVSVVVGRFQCSSLTKAHKQLLLGCDDGTADELLVVLGVGPIAVTPQNPLSFEARKQMIVTEISPYRNVRVTFIKDVGNWSLWSHILDDSIKELYTSSDDITLYGGRDSFIDLGQYCGEFHTKIYNVDASLADCSATLLRDHDKRTIVNSPAWRAGVIWATQNQWPVVRSVVDIAMIDLQNKKILLGRKRNQDQWRFPGGFVDPEDSTALDAAIREAREETTIDLLLTGAKANYICTCRIDDWRFRTEPDKLMTTFYMFDIDSNRFKGRAGDDLNELEWFDFKSDLIDVMRPAHRKLFNALMTYLDEV